MTSRGKLIVVEGLEGAGKTTAIATVKNYLESMKKIVRLTREPGGTKIGEGLRSLVKKCDKDEPLSAHSELLMMYAARVQLVEHVIEPALQRGDWVIADRFELSSYAYQGGGRGIDKKSIDSLSAICLKGFKPDLVLFLDIAPETGLERIKNRAITDRIEQESLLFFNKVNEAYHQRITEMDNVAIINAREPIARVQELIITQLKIFLPCPAHA